MENQVNVSNQNSQQIGQNPIGQPVPIPEKPKINYLTIGGIILFCFAIFGIGGYYLGTKQWAIKNSEPLTNITPSFSPTPSETPSLTADWKTYTITMEPTLGLANYTVKVPASWKQIEHSSNFQNTETFQDTYEKFIYQLIIHQEKNFNEQTGKPYTTLKELTGFPYDVTMLVVDGQQAAQVLPRAGSESDYKVLFFSKDTNLVISIELDTPQDGSKVKDGEELFNQILSTFNFIDKSAPSNKFTLGMYKNCRVYSRSSINIPSSDTTLNNRSEVRCESDGKEQVLLKILDKLGFETAKNSVYRIWKDTEGYKALLVDQNGAGSGEGNGKIILLKNNTYKLFSCFYYIPENFSGKYGDPLSESEITKVNGSTPITSESDCSNFVFESSIN